MGRYSRSRSRSRSAEDDDGFRVHIADLSVDSSQRELEKTFGKFGDIKGTIFSSYYKIGLIIWPKK